MLRTPALYFTVMDPQCFGNYFTYLCLISNTEIHLRGVENRVLESLDGLRSPYIYRDNDPDILGLLEQRIVLIFSTYMENNFSLIVHPSYDHVGAWHLSIGQETESHPTLRTDTHSELDSFHGEVVAPVEL